MRILPVTINHIHIAANRDASQKPNFNKALPADSITFTGVSHGGIYLKKLAAYGIPDMYTGKLMLSQLQIDKFFNEKIFKKNIKLIVKALSPYKQALQPIEAKFFIALNNLASKNPNISLEEAVKIMRPENEKKLLRSQQHIFETLTAYACDMPPKQFNEFLELMNITQKRLLNDPVVLPFKENEFLYKLKRILREIQIKNKRSEVYAMKKLEVMATTFFSKNTHKNENYLDQNVLKHNSNKIKILRAFQKKSVLKNNSTLNKLFEDTSARIHGFPYIEAFGRKSFIHDIRKITDTLADKQLAQKIIDTASKLPTSTNSLPAFIIKYAEENSEKIGFHLIKNSIASIDHLIPKIRGGYSRLSNYGLCSVGINSIKTDIPFDKWVRLHPEIYQNCQKHVNRLIELYNQGIFDKIDLPRSYIIDFAQTIYNISPKEKRIILDLSKLYD